MRQLAVLASLAGFLIAPAVATAEPISLTMAQILDAVPALLALDGYKKLDKENKAVTIPYTLSGAVRLSIDTDLRKLRAAVSDFQTTRNAKIMELSKGAGSIKPGSPEEGELNRATSEMLTAERKIDAVKFTKEDLGLMPPASNPIAGTTLTGLGPLFPDDTESTPHPTASAR